MCLLRSRYVGFLIHGERHLRILYLVLSISFSIDGKPFQLGGLPSRYHVSGVIQLPYAEISEPFESWIDVESGFSRIDYYGGLDSFFFSSDFICILQVRRRLFNEKAKMVEIMERILKSFQSRVNNNK